MAGHPPAGGWPATAGSHVTYFFNPVTQLGSASGVERALRRTLNAHHIIISEEPHLTGRAIFHTVEPKNNRGLGEPNVVKVAAPLIDDLAKRGGHGF